MTAKRAKRNGRNGRAGQNRTGRTPLCLVPGCTRPAARRGLCEPCYQSAARFVRFGGTTWDELVQLGLAEPGLTRQPAIFRQAFEQLREKAAQKFRKRRPTRSRSI